jgi:hypothetical protein
VCSPINLVPQEKICFVILFMGSYKTINLLMALFLDNFGGIFKEWCLIKTVPTRLHFPPFCWCIVLGVPWMQWHGVLLLSFYCCFFKRCPINLVPLLASRSPALLPIVTIIVIFHFSYNCFIDATDCVSSTMPPVIIAATGKNITLSHDTCPTLYFLHHKKVVFS